MPDRRPLDFDRIDAIMPDVERLLAGHAMVGRWTLGETCDHLATAVTLSLRGHRSEASPTREQDVARHRSFRDRTIPTGQAIPNPALAPNPTPTRMPRPTPSAMPSDASSPTKALHRSTPSSARSLTTSGSSSTASTAPIT